MIIVFIFFAIILVFIFWGVGPGGKRDETGNFQVVATVDGVDIPVGEYSALYKRQVEYYGNLLKGEGADKLLEKLNLRQKTIDMLIERALAFREAEKKGMSASDKEIQDKIVSMPVFQKDGVFNKELYFSVLRSNRIEPADFEKDVGDELLIEKVRETVISEVGATDDEAKRLFEKQSRHIALEYIKIGSSGLIPGVTAAEEEAKKYLEDNGASFMVPTKIKAFYAYADTGGLEKGIKIPEDNLRDYYGKNIAIYQRPGRVKARHILIRPDAKEEDGIKAKKEALEKARKILADIKKGADFSEIAKKHSQDPGSSPRGGDIGYFGRGAMVKPFEDAAFALKKGQISGIVETEYGFHIIKADDKEEEGVLPFEKVKKDIENSIVAEEAGKMAREKMSEVRELLKQDLSPERLKEEAVKRNVKTDITDFFTEEDRDVSLAKDKKLKDNVFALEKGGVSGIVETPGRLYVIKVTERVEKHVQPYDEIKERVKAALRKEKAKKAAEKKAAGLLKGIREGSENFSAAAKAGGYKAGKTDFFTFSQGFIPQLGVFIGDREDLFALKNGGLYPEVVSKEDDFYIFKLLDAKEASMDEFEKKKAEIKENLLARKKEEALKKWLEGLKARSNITINRELL